MDYAFHIVVLIGIYVILASSLNLLVGYSGLVSIAHAGFYGIGAYAAAILARDCHTPFAVNVVFAAVVSGILALAIGLPSLRVRGDQFIVASFAVQLLFYDVMKNWDALTGGPAGFPNISQPSIGPLRIDSTWKFACLVAVLAVLATGVVRRLVLSPFGRVLKVIREDELPALAAGKNVASFKILATILSAVLASVAGATYAQYIGFIDPDTFTVNESIFIISIVIVGGAGSVMGPTLGAFLLVLLPEILRFVGLPGATAPNVRQIIYGGLLVLFVVWRPRGLVGQHGFDER